MGSRTARPRLLSATALVGALLWGAVELFALQASRLLHRQTLRGRAKGAW